MSISEEDYFTIKYDDFVVPFRLSGEAKKNCRFFTDVYITPRALLNMMNHSLTTKKEIMGYLAGHFKGSSYFITDAVALPIEGTETRVTSNDASLYKAILHFEDMRRLGRPEDETGWYHSHPGLWCFFSRIDVQNQRNNQLGRGGCFVGLVIDPLNTTSSGKLHLGAYSAINEDEVNEEENIPDYRLMKYGSMANHYYELNIHYFKTKTDDTVLKDIISKSYFQTISSSPLDLNAEYIGKNSEQAAKQMRRLFSSEKCADDLPQLKKMVQSINNDRKVGIGILKMKKSVFG